MVSLHGGQLRGMCARLCECTTLLHAGWLVNVQAREVYLSDTSAETQGKLRLLLGRLLHFGTQTAGACGCSRCTKDVA